MIEEFPVTYTLESGTQVVVKKEGSNSYHFTLKATQGATEHFTYVEDGRSKEEVENDLSFQELDALRTFWLMNTDII